MITKKELLYARAIALVDMHKSGITNIPVEKCELKRLIVIINTNY